MYNKAWTRVLIVPAGAICLFLSGSANGAGDDSSVDGWQKIAPPNGGFSVKIPGTPKEYTVLAYRQTRDRLVAVTTINVILQRQPVDHDSTISKPPSSPTEAEWDA